MKGSRILGARVVAIRKKKRLTQLEVTKACRWGTDQLRLIETGASLPKLVTLMELAAALGISPSDLLDGIDLTSWLNEIGRSEFRITALPARRPVQRRPTSKKSP